MKIQCRCGATCQVSQNAIGRKVKCKNCESVFLVPQPSPSQLPVVAPPPLQPKPLKPSKEEREDALLSNYAQKSGPTLEERIADRRTERIEAERYTNGVKYLVVGIIFMAIGVGAYLLFDWMNRGQWAVPRIVAVLYYAGGKWWVSAIFILIGIYNAFLGIGSMLGFVDIDENEDIPESF